MVRKGLRPAFLTVFHTIIGTVWKAQLCKRAIGDDMNFSNFLKQCSNNLLGVVSHEHALRAARARAAQEWGGDRGAAMAHKHAEKIEELEGLNLMSVLDKLED